MRNALTRLVRLAAITVAGCILLCTIVAAAETGVCKQATGAADVALLNAAEHSDFGAFRTALDQGANVNARDAKCNTALIWAARSINRGIAGELLALEVNFDVKNSLGKTALAYANERDAEMKAQIEAAIKGFDEGTLPLIAEGKFEGVLAAYDRRMLDPDYEFSNFSPGMPGYVSYYNGRTAIMLATVGTLAEVDVLPFVKAMIERGATTEGGFSGDSLAEAAISGNRLNVLALALSRTKAASEDLARKVADKGSGDFALAAMKLIIGMRDPATPLVPWLEAAARLNDPRAEALRLLIKDDETVSDVGTALKVASGPALHFLLAHGAAAAKDDPLIARILGIDSYGLNRATAIDLDLLELALDRGARADVKVWEYDPQPDIIAVMLDNLFAHENASNSIDPAQLRRVLEKLIKTGALLRPTDYNRNWPDPVEQVLNAGTHREILKDVLGTLDELGATAPELCNYIQRFDIAIIVQLLEFSSSSESGERLYNCVSKIGRENAGTPKARQNLYRALADHAVEGRQAALEDELARIDGGGGDTDSVAALVVPGDLLCSANDGLANRIAKVVGRAAPC